jgi:pyroglutamyl-peptidase
MFKKIVIGAVFCVLAACGESGEQGWIHEDSGPEGLFGDFFRDGKFDGMGHPAGASVFEAVDACEAGRVVPGDDKPGVICSGTSPTLGRGGHAINVRALVEQLPGQICQEEVCPADDVFILRVQSGEEVLGEKLFTTDDFREEMRYQNLYVDFRMSQSGEVAFELEWPGMVPVEIEYIEIFLAMRRVILEPPSGVVTEGDFTIEIRDPEPDATITVACNGEDFTAVLDGLATDETSEFRRLLTAPADLLFADCAAPRWVLVEVEQGSSVERRETLYLDEAEVCGFNDGAARVLITGFVPFPPNPTDPRYQRPNSSQAAVTGFDPAVFIDDPDLPEVSVVVLQLPVEFDSAPDLLADVIARCQPEVVIGFGGVGQGRWAVDLETTAYNLKDTSDVAGGVPDNRGVVAVQERIEAEGPDEVYTGLPYEDILQELNRRGVTAKESDDPGRYVCNNLFYRIMQAAGPDAAAGFIHLPRMYSIGETEKQKLQTTVEVAVRQALLAR